MKPQPPIEPQDGDSNAPVPIVNGQPFSQPTPVTGSVIEQQSDQAHSKKWRNFFIVLGILQTLGVAIWIAVILWAITQAKAGVSGTEFIPLLLLPLVWGVGLLALINLIGLPIYLVKRKPSGKALVFGIFSLLISLGLFLYGVYSFYQIKVAYPKHRAELQAELQSSAQDQARQYRAQSKEITKEYAIQLLQNCKLSGFYYTNQNSRDSGGWGNLSSTGVVLTYVGGQPYRISIADRLIPELAPIAREAQKTCDSPQFWHDGRYEQRQADGTWQ